MADTDGDWVPKPYVSGEARPRGEGSIFDPARGGEEAEGPKVFVTGWPVWHSRSPMIHGSWLKELGLAGSYRRVGVPPEEIADFFRTLKASGYVGGNVTIPHKVAAFKAVSRRDAAADATGAVNTLWFDKSGRLVGGNTDPHGFAANLDERLPGWVDAETAVVLGAGGAARAVVHALLKRGLKRVEIVNRTKERAEELAERFGSRVAGHSQEARGEVLGRADLLVNTVPIAPKDSDDETPDWFPQRLPDLSALPDQALVTDIVYTPLMTPTLLSARERGLRYADGLGMLLHQAVPGFERWFGQRPTVTETLRAKVEADIESGA
ncbi:shikimate dehydrogenase [Aurantimonas sp. VKM B-3413]|uniref:shikimate dehydrogenase n=1 Tax=Aurantimonas sp. VKM B-3413 TaxID=2779401 RepID=UPI002107E09F|nr:shikimate dehydrogenase [Aurantimonas sp. VKM B-3413]MCB8840572.1 shikimate dehydrogenase [Aurantimonas sp. VKM B-3413]